MINIQPVAPSLQTSANVCVVSQRDTVGKSNINNHPVAAHIRGRTDLKCVCVCVRVLVLINQKINTIIPLLSSYIY